VVGTRDRSDGARVRPSPTTQGPNYNAAALPPSEWAKFALVQQAITHLSQSHRIWRIIQEIATNDRKHNAGASSLTKRTGVRAGLLQIPKVQANLSVTGLEMGTVKMFMLPDMILYFQGSMFANIPYEVFGAKSGTTQFIENESVPQDAAVVEWTWRYVNKNGGADRRFNNNRKLPIARYGVLELFSSTGLNIHLNVSSVEKAAAFANCIRELWDRNSRPGTTPPPAIPPPKKV